MEAILDDDSAYFAKGTVLLHLRFLKRAVSQISRQQL